MYAVEIIYKIKNMVYFNEKIKKYLKVISVLIGVLFLWGIFNLFTGRSINNKMTTEPAQTPMMSGASKNDLSWQSNVNKVSDAVKFSENVQVVNRKEDTLLNSDSDKIISDKKIIKNGSLNLKVDKVPQATKEIGNIVRGLGGEIFSTNFSERIRGQRRGSMTVRVPVDKFSEAISKIKSVATQVVKETTTGRDVTEQYADLQAQLKNKQAEEASFVKILDRAEKIDDVLAVTRQLSRVRGEIERLQGRIKYMNSQTDMSTITVNLSEDVGVISVSDNWRPMQTVKKSFKELVNNIQDFIDNSIRFVIVGIPSLIPFLLFLAIIYWGGKKIYRKVKK
ncbi:MAG TPA: DUF4349 domain-containing protein [Candidatus Moranbacteria bacterium]|nr:DUF4349 domain-containing protein [Candidatus Moranbacteria bacterium]